MGPISKTCKQLSSSLDFPPELWASVFEKACMDDGTTGRSLSLVSRRFAGLCDRIKYNSIEIRGRNQAEAFREMLLAHPDRETPRVRHLLLDLRFMSTATPLNSEGGGREQPQPGERGYMEELLDTLMDDRKISFWNSMISLLDILSPHLVTLAIVFTPCVANVGLPLPLPNKTFPLLSELTVCTAPYVPDPIHAQFPALKYLHLSYCITYFEVFRDKIPALSHLRITGHTIAMSPPGHKHSTLPIDLELMPQFERLAICPDDPNFEQRKLPEFPQEIRDVTDILQPAVSTGIHDSIYVEIEKDWTRGVEGRRGSYW